MDAWDFIVEHWKPLEAMCKYDDDCFAYAVLDRVPSVVERWDGTRSLKTWVYMNVRWYVHKWFNRKQTVELPELSYTTNDDKIEVAEILEKLSDFDRMLLTLRFLKGCTYFEIASIVGINRESVRRMVNAALQQCYEQGIR